MIPEIAEYEVRRETLRSGNVQALRALDRLTEDLRYVALTTTAMRLAAQLRAQTRRDGYRTADDAALDVDVILAAQAAVVASIGEPTVIATENRRHLGRLAPAQHWDELSRS